MVAKNWGTDHEKDRVCCYAMLGNDNPDSQVSILRDNTKLFQGVKIGAFRFFKISDPQFQENIQDTLALCRQNNWPVLVHCSADDDQDLQGVIQLAKDNPDIRFCASHFGGDISARPDQEGRTLDRTKLLKDLPKNLWFNVAVKDLKFVWDILKVFPELLDQMVFSSDIPFIDKDMAMQIDAVTKPKHDNLDQQGRQFLFG